METTQKFLEIEQKLNKILNEYKNKSSLPDEVIESLVNELNTIIGDFSQNIEKTEEEILEGQDKEVNFKE